MKNSGTRNLFANNLIDSQNSVKVPSVVGLLCSNYSFYVMQHTKAAEY